MKFKTILVIALVILTVFVIYLTTMDRNIYYLDFCIDFVDFGVSSSSESR